jgi:hypothetical protein
VPLIFTTYLLSRKATIVVTVTGETAFSDDLRLTDLSRTDITVSELPDIGWPKRPGKYYVKLILDEDAKKTVVSSRGNAVSWRESFCL